MSIRRACLLLSLTFVLGSCDRHGELVIFPEFDFEYSFEGGFEGWTPVVTDETLSEGDWSVERTTTEAFDGAAAVRLTMNVPTGGGGVWLLRELEVTPSQAYDVAFSFALGTADQEGTSPWTLIVGAHTEAPSAAGELSLTGATGSGVVDGTDLAWIEHAYTVTGQADAEGRLYLALGVWGTTAGAREYFFDDVRVSLTRR